MVGDGGSRKKTKSYYQSNIWYLYWVCAPQTIKLFDTVIAMVTSDPSRYEVDGMQNWHENAKQVHDKEHGVLDF